MSIVNNPQARARPATRAATCWRTLRGSLIVPVLALLSMTTAASADSPVSAIQILDVDVVQRDLAGVRNDCWDDAPMDATVSCAPPTPEIGDLTATIELAMAASSDVVIEYESMDLTATAGTDYVALDGSLTIKAGEREGSIDIDFIDDLVEEGNEEFVVALTGTEGINLKHTHIHVTILDEESIKVLIANASQTEGHPDGMLVDLSFTESVPWPFTIRARTTAGTAGTSDYQDWPKLSSSLIVGTPERPVISFRFRHPLINDSLDEPNETYTITAWGYDNLGRESNSATMTIIDDDDAPEASIADASGLEDSVGKLSFDVTLNTASAKEITLNYATSDDTATAGSDYTQTNGTLTFSAGETTKTISVPVLEDGSPEEDETFTVTLSNAANATIGDGTGTGTIQDDDPVPASLSIEDAVALESREAMEFPVTLSGDREEGVTVTVDYATADRTAEAGSDYTETTGTLTFATDVTQQTIRVPLLDDVIDEGHDIFVVLLSNAMGATFSDSLAEGKILDDDIASTKITLIASPARISEDDGATDIDVTAMLDGAGRTSAIEVTVSVAGSGNAGAVDFAEVEDFTITIAALHNRGEGTFTLTPIDDDVDESDETLSVTGTSFMTVTGTEVELVDDDATSSSIALTAQPPRVSEGDGSTEVGVTATLDAGARTEETTVTVTVSGSGDADAVDFADVRDFTITIAEGDTSGTGSFTLTPEDDNVDESEETLTVGGNSDLPVTADTVALADNDQPSAGILLTASPGRIAEDGGARSVQVTATLDASARAVATTVSVSVAGSEQSDAVDYSASTTVFDITIAAGATAGTGTFTVTPEDDEVDERDEVLDITGTSDLPVTPTSVTLTDDDQTSTEILLSAVPSTVSEGAGETSVVVTVTLDAGARTVSTTVTVEVTDTGDPDAVDFTAPQHFVIPIAAGATSGRGTFILVPEDDNLEESSETLTLAGMADLPVTDTSVTITDNDIASDGILLAASPSVVSEGGGAAPVRVTASLNGSARTTETTVTVSVAGSGDPQAVDFEPVQDFEITIAESATSGEGTFTLVPVNDSSAEADETLTVSGMSDLDVEPATVRLADDDEASSRILLSVSPGRVSEGDGPTGMTVTAALDRGSRQQAMTVAVSVSGSGDPGAVDFESVDGFAITIPANAASGTGTFTLTPEDDETVESDERLTVSGVSDLPVIPAAVTLADDDEVSTRILLFLTVDPPRGSEGDGEIRVTVTAEVDRGVRPDETRIAVSVEGSGDPAAVDFAPIPDFDVVIPANAPSGTGTFTVMPEDDLIVEADETLTVSGVADLPVAPATMELLDDDEASAGILLSADPARVSEGDGPVAVTVTATLDRGLRQEATTVIVSVEGSGDPAAVDFVPVPDFSITIAPNAPSGTGTFALTPEDDAEDEADETLTLTGESGLPVTPISIVLADDDEMMVSRALSIDDAEAAEGAGEILFVVTLDGPSAAEVTVGYATADPAGSLDPVAAAGIDYESASGTLTFAPGEVSRTIRVPIVDDDLDEPDETFALVLSDPRGATLRRGSALGVIRDDDEPPALSVADAAGDEDVGALEFEVTLSAPSGIEVSAAYATKDGTAESGGDYAAATGTLVFAPGEVSRTIRVAILDDALHEADEETFELTLARLVNATADDVSATGTIRDNDLAPPSVAGDLPAALLCVGGAPYELDLANYFAGEELRFSAVSSTPLVATAALDGSMLTIAPASEGESTVTVTATNDAGSASGSIGVRVVADPAEIEAVESVLASIGRVVLTGVTDSVRARFGPRSASGEQETSTNVQRGRTQVVPGASAVLGNQWPGPPMRGTRSGGWDKSNLFEPQVPGDDWFETMNRTYRRGMVPFSFSLDSAQSGSTGPAWGVWGRADAHRFESGIDGSSHDGTLTAVHLGADARVGDWLAGVSVARSAADADYRFERSVDACGGGGIGEGMVDAELTSVHPYVGRQIGRGSMWATLGAGGGEVSVERCETGQRNQTDLSMRLAALGGRHPFAGGERMEVSVVEEISVLDLKTGDAVGPVGDRSVTVGQARLGLEASGVVPAGCDCSLSSFVRAFARGDWGDGATGTGLELAAGVRFRNHPRRLGIDAGIRALAAHSAEDASERSANLTFSILPKADGTGWQASLAWRRGAGDSRLDALGGISPWTSPSASLPGAERRWIAESRLGYGIRLSRGFATPFVELDAGHSGRGGARFGVRHEFGDRVRGLVVEWGIEPSSLGSAGSRILLEALGRF